MSAARTRSEARTNAARTGQAAQATPRSPARLAPRDVFLTRFRRGATYGFALVAGALAIGIIGYHLLEQMSWLDAFHQSSLLLSGVGSAVEMRSTAGKIFDSIYALFCGVILLAATGLMLAPVIHRLLHRFHLEDARDR